jgi:hypothetical protein
VPSQLKGNKRLSANALKSLGLKPLPADKVAAVGKLKKRAVAATVDLYYSIDTYDTNFYFIYYYQNDKICTTTGTNCLPANAYLYSYYMNYYGNWYSYGEFGPERG